MLHVVIKCDTCSRNASIWINGRSYCSQHAKEHDLEYSKQKGFSLKK